MNPTVNPMMTLLLRFVPTLFPIVAGLLASCSMVRTGCGACEAELTSVATEAPTADDEASAAAAAPAGKIGVDRWPTYHGDFDLDGVAHASVPDRPAVAWRFLAGREVSYPPVAAGGFIHFLTDRGEMITVDLEGKEKWRAKLEKDEFSSPPIVTDGSVVAGSLYGKLFAFEAASGEKRWEYDTLGNVQGSPGRVDLGDGRVGIVINSQSDGVLHCVDLATGKKAWVTEPIDRCDGSLSVSDGRIAMGSCASALHVFEIGAAAKTADIEIGGDNQVAGGVAFDGAIAYAGTRSGGLVAADVAEKKILWVNSDARGETFTTPAIGEKVVVFGSDDGRVYALDRKTGKQVWAYEADDTPSSPVIAGNRVVVTAGGSLILLDFADGSQVFTTEISDWTTAPSIVGGLILIGADDGTLTAFGEARPASEKTEGE